MKVGTKWSAAPIILFALLLLMSVYVAADTTPDGYTYTTGNDGITITGYTGTEVNLVIPATIGDLPVKAIGNSAFQNRAAIESVTLPDSVMTIGNSAFDSCYSLKSISLGEGIRTIGANGFMKCHALTALDLPNGITSIGDNAFENCISLAEIGLPAGLKSIAFGLFKNCTNLESASLPAGLTSIKVMRSTAAVS